MNSTPVSDAPGKPDDPVPWRDSVALLLKVTWPFLASVPLLLLIAGASFHLMAAGRAYVEGESLWSKGQKESIQFLARYSESCDPALFARHEAALAVPLGDRIARMELLKPEPDLARARDGFLQGGNHPAEVAGMITLFRYFRGVPLMGEAIAIWGAAEVMLLEQAAAGDELRRQVEADCHASDKHHAAMAAIYALNDRLTPLQRNFSETLGRANRLIKAALLTTMSVAGLLLALLGTVLALRVVQRGATAERALALSERRYQLAVAGSRQGLWDLNIATGDLFVSQGLKQLLGRGDSAAALGRKDLLRQLHPDERDAVMDRLRGHARRGTQFREEFRMRGSDGRFGWFRTAGQAVLDAQGQPLRLIGSVHDITEQHQLQLALVAELDQRRAALRTLRATLADLAPADAGPAPPGAGTGAGDDDIDAVTQAVAALAARQHATNAELSAILDLSPDGFVSFDRRRSVNHVSPAFASITGLAPAEVLGLDEDAFVERLNRLCRPHAALPRLAALRRGADAGPVVLEFAGAGHRVLTAELREGGQSAVRSVLCLRDMTREHEVERLKNEFMSVAAHELRTPMASIYGFVELVLHRKMSDERRTEVLHIVHRQSRLMIGIIDDVLDLSRLEARRGADLAMLPLDLSALVRTAAEGFELMPGRTPPTLGALPPGLVVTGDRDKLLRVLTNVLSNAYKYSPQGGAVRIAVLAAAEDTGAQAAEPQPARIGVRIEDQGIGMTAAQLQRVGERFFRADASGNIPGTGLGMSIVREIVQLHGGRLALDSTPGTGTCVTVWLPLRQPAPASQARPAEALAAADQ